MGSEGSPLRGSGPGSGESAGAINEMERMLRELRAAQEAMRRKSLIAFVLIILIMVGFGSAGYVRVRDNFAAEKLQAAASMRLQLLLPQLEPPLTATMREVAPYYLEMGRVRFEQMGPRLDARVQHEADKLGRDLEKQLQTQLDIYFAKLDLHAAAELRRNFPAVAKDPKGAGERIHSLLMAQAGKLHTEGKAIYDAKASQVRQSLARFPVPDVKQTDLETLNRQLLHDLLMLADYEMTGHGNGLAVAEVAAK